MNGTKRGSSADHDRIGRILKCHLVIEIYLVEYLSKRFPSHQWDRADCALPRKWDDAGTMSECSS